MAPRVMAASATQAYHQNQQPLTQNWVTNTTQHNRQLESTRETLWRVPATEHILVPIMPIPTCTNHAPLTTHLPRALPAPSLPQLCAVSASHSPDGVTALIPLIAANATRTRVNKRSRSAPDNAENTEDDMTPPTLRHRTADSDTDDDLEMLHDTDDGTEILHETFSTTTHVQQSDIVSVHFSIGSYTAHRSVTRVTDAKRCATIATTSRSDLEGIELLRQIFPEKNNDELNKIHNDHLERLHLRATVNSAQMPPPSVATETNARHERQRVQRLNSRHASTVHAYSAVRDDSDYIPDESNCRRTKTNAKNRHT
jgi:hypothetical protein